MQTLKLEVDTAIIPKNENAPMLQNMGGVALREEIEDKPAAEANDV
jgi:hypothetical protein